MCGVLGGALEPAQGDAGPFAAAVSLPPPAFEPLPVPAAEVPLPAAPALEPAQAAATPVAVVASQPPPAAEPLPVPAAEVSLPRAEAAAFVFAPLPNISAGDYCACTADGVSGGSNTTAVGCGQWLLSQGSNAWICFVREPSLCYQGMALTVEPRFPGAAYRSCPPPAPGSTASSTGEPLPTVGGVLRSAPQLSTLSDALRAADLQRVAGDQVTVFAPSNAAFTSALLSGRLWELLTPNQAAAVASGGTSGTGGPVAAAMQQLLLDHLAPGRLLVADLERLAAADGSAGAPGPSAAVVAASDGAAAQGSAFLTMLSGRQALVTTQNGSVTVGNASISLPDLQASNGAVHVMQSLVQTVPSAAPPPSEAAPSAEPPPALPVPPPAAEQAAPVLEAPLPSPFLLEAPPLAEEAAVFRAAPVVLPPPAAPSPAPPLPAPVPETPAVLAPPAPAPESVAGSCATEAATDLAGGDLPDDGQLSGPQRRVADVAACCAKCLARADCAAWVFGDTRGCPNCCFLKAATGWSRQPSAALVAGTVASRGVAPAAAAAQSPSPPPAPQQPPPPSPSPSPSPPPPPPPSQQAGGAAGSCATEAGTDLAGGDLRDDRQLRGPQRRVADVKSCCAKCVVRADCAAWVFGNAPGCPNCCFLKAASGWSRQPSAALTAGTGLVVSTSSEPDEGACCQRCRAHPTCNAFVYCPQPGGCMGGTLYPSRLCSLKQQPADASGRPDLASYGSGPEVPWTSGWIAKGGASVSPTPAPAAASASDSASASASSSSSGRVQLLP
ncbi:hypothetical protein CHLNCDRAFT_134449 [Chlorella variabilis]|uniref:FAS1 domain-containing protein n=1 Tax=Chlorella variabilis TaxID=554065 RepID=E1ZG06_CHLVA|nr:hypothetical protein CHLNCDRAFT_134449 [Chlorella variabilis]EFN55214.1 hypothetical protein CHLNCDRAFT_134449 [Chlorella variabilis]|eukprot:XP_005847316.1 hypothetical protein CHLNCDRAFT_134449 [Chlorella variabilis]